MFEDERAETRKIVEKLRKVLMKAMPDTQEIVYHGSLGYSPTGHPFDRIVYIMAAKSHVTLGFFGSHLPDPEPRLQGEGKRMRHVKIRTVEEVDDAAVGRLVEAAGLDAPESLAAIRQQRQTKWGARRRVGVSAISAVSALAFWAKFSSWARTNSEKGCWRGCREGVSRIERP